ncbi:hypothetical protein BEP19_13365 [Ammoniphilus oxalaticus]|uniref:Uncharacterized protein n=2 Tax=Ammoniphilus oxalaticus TaxID=66863 RepID=A0A419SF90_9BACL|nr:hypothetical protein BEP19_13365 [Ammoniphilus oxalaticus]
MLLIVCGFCLLAIIVYRIDPFFMTKKSLSSSLGPKEVVEKFYAYEQAGDFGSSWELFHPLMKEKFNKQQYIQARARVFLEDFGVETFEVRIGELVEESSWRMSPLSPVLTDTQKAPVLLVYHSIFGDLQIRQDVYVALDEENSDYRILWAYSQQK